MDFCLFLALAATFGGALARSPALVGCGGLLVARIAIGRFTATQILLAVAIFCSNGFRAYEEVARAASQYQSAAESFRGSRECDFEATVFDSPIAMVRPPEVAGDEESIVMRSTVEVVSGTCGSIAMQRYERLRLYAVPADARRGDRLRVLARVSPLYRFANEGLRDPHVAFAHSRVVLSATAIDAELVTRGVGLSAAVDRARLAVRSRIQATFHPRAKRLARALVLGECDLDSDEDDAFRRSGLAHLLAVSGTHLVLAVLTFVRLLEGALLRLESLSSSVAVSRVAAAVGIPTALLYADFAGASGSANRAAWMLSAILLARVVDRRPSAARSLAIALATGVCFDSLVVYDVSFALSALATTGLMVLSRPLERRMSFGPAPVRKVIGAVSTTLSAMLPCAPLLALLAPTLPLLGIGANVLAAPLGELIALPACLLHALLFWAAPLEKLCAMLGSGALLSVLAIALRTAHAGLDVHVPSPTEGQLTLLVVAGFAAWLMPRAFRLVIGIGALLSISLLEVFAHASGKPLGLLRVTALDIGQGDSIFLDLPDGRFMVVDGGGLVGSPIDTGARVLEPVMRARRRSQIDVMVLSHPHPDHFSGLLRLARNFRVVEFWDTGQGIAQGAGPVYAELIATLRDQGTWFRSPRDLCSASQTFGTARIDILAPCPAFDEDSSANDNSFTLRVSLGSKVALLVGDSEELAESRLLERYSGELRGSLLKVGHHGSRTSSTPAFVESVAPEFAFISCGVRNRFGHPRAETLQTLNHARAAVLRTDQLGSLTWQTDGKTATVRAALPQFMFHGH